MVKGVEGTLVTALAGVVSLDLPNFAKFSLIIRRDLDSSADLLASASRLIDWSRLAYSIDISIKSLWN